MYVPVVEAAQNGDVTAKEQLYTLFFDDLYYYILKTVNDSQLAEDLVQDTFVEIFCTLEKLREPVAFITWSRKIAYHKCTAYFRKRKELLADEDEEGNSIFHAMEEDRSEFIPDEALDAEDFKKTIQDMIDALPPEQRAAIMMRYFDEISVQEIAEIQNVSEGTVKSRLNYARKAIKKCVEAYEKKNNIKLRCVGVVPMLLWLFRQAKLANGISGATQAAAAATAAAGTVSAASATGEAVSGAMATAVGEAGVSSTTVAAQTGAKATAFVGKKIIAGLTATAVVAGGAVAGVMLTHQQPAPTAWYGYGEYSHSITARRFDLNVETMNDQEIQGNLQVTNLYQVVYDTHFTGTGVEENGKLHYDLKLDTPAVVGTIPTFEYTELAMEYDKTSQTFTLDDFCRVVMEPVQDPDDAPVLAQQVTWSGMGEDIICNTQEPDHRFTLEVQKMTTQGIQGQLTVSKGDVVEHESGFQGRSYEADGNIYYEIQLDNPRTEDHYMVGEITVDCFWLIYDLEKEIFRTDTVSGSSVYRFQLEKNS